MKNALRFIILIIVFIGTIIFLSITSADEVLKRDKVLNNNVEFSGYVIDFRTSHNHAFGVIRLQVTNSSVNLFNDSLKNGIYPYKLYGDLAEIYTTIPAGLDYYDKFTVRSRSHALDFESKKDDVKYTSEIYVIESSQNIDFVRKHTQF